MASVSAAALAPLLLPLLLRLRALPGGAASARLFCGVCLARCTASAMDETDENCDEPFFL